MNIFNKKVNLKEIAELVLYDYKYRDDLPNEAIDFIKETMPVFKDNDDGLFIEPIKNLKMEKGMFYNQYSSKRYCLFDENRELVHDANYPYTRIIDKGYLVVLCNDKLSQYPDFDFALDIYNITVTLDNNAFSYNVIQDDEILNEMCLKAIEAYYR